jgi:hypothetical protein
VISPSQTNTAPDLRKIMEQEKEAEKILEPKAKTK